MLRSRLLITAALFSALFVIGEFFFVPVKYVDSALLSALVSPRIVFDGFRNSHAIVEQLKDLTVENQALRGQLAQALSLPRIVDQGKERYLRATVYSTYPLTSSRALMINVGSEEGVKAGQTVTVKPGLFIGEIITVYPHQSVVHTIFDATPSATSTPWQLPVKIGNGIDSLLVTGLEPRLTIVSRKKGMQTGDSVTLASKQYPYGLSIGSVGALIDDPTNVFVEARLTTPYALADLEEVFVMLGPSYE